MLWKVSEKIAISREQITYIIKFILYYCLTYTKKLLPTTNFKIYYF